MTYYFPSEVGIAAVAGGTGNVVVNGETLTCSRSMSVLSSLAVINRDAAGTGLEFLLVEPNTEYWIYLANTIDPAFVTNGLPEDPTHAAAPAWDYRGKMFLSLSPNIDGYLSDQGSGKNALLVGKVETDASSKFIRDVDISLVSRTVNFPETYRNYSDYQLQFVDQNTLCMKLLDGEYGQIAINQDLYYLGADYDIDIADAWIEWDTGTVSRQTSALLPNTTYYAYLPSDIDSFNFNAVNPDTGRPWQVTDYKATTNYQAVLDLRLRPFLSTKAPEHGRMSDQWPGYEARNIGVIRTDGNGVFVNASDISIIQRQAFNPSYLDGLAEISLDMESDSSLKFPKKGGSSGIVNVGGQPVQSYDLTDPNCWIVRTSDLVQEYTEANQSAPLSALDAVSTYTGQLLYVYLANGWSFWDGKENNVFVCNTAPSGGYLSRNWPGNNARWLATVAVSADGRFLGSYIVDSIQGAEKTINDSVSSPSTTLSSAKIYSLLAPLNANIAYTAARNAGYSLRLDYVDSTTIRLVGLVDETIVAFPDSQVFTIPSGGLDFTIPPTTAAGTIWYVYLKDDGTIYLSSTAPTGLYQNLRDNGTDSILVGWLTVASTGHLGGTWNVFSFWNQPAQVFSAPIFNVSSAQSTISLPGFFFPDLGSASWSVDTIIFDGDVWHSAFDGNTYYAGHYEISYADFRYHEIDTYGYFSIQSSHDHISQLQIADSPSVQHATSYTSTYLYGSWAGYGQSTSPGGKIYLTRTGT
ncbi:MAG: hypothetical protein WBG50_10075 [Desulfomonilaceae bacterium]